MPRMKPFVGAPDGFKGCLCCQTIKPLTGFTLDRDASDGLRRYCRTCDMAKSVVVRQRRRTLALAVKAITNPTALTPAERDERDNAFADAIVGGTARLAASIAAVQALKASSVPAPKRIRKSVDPVKRARDLAQRRALRAYHARYSTYQPVASF